MSKKQVAEEYAEAKAPTTRCQQLCDVLGACNIGHDVTPGKIAIVVGTHAGVEGKHGTVCTFEHDDNGKIFRVTLG